MRQGSGRWKIMRRSDAAFVASALHNTARIIRRLPYNQRYAADGRYASSIKTVRPCAGPEWLWGLLALDHARQGPGIARDSLDGCAARRLHAWSDSMRLPGTGPKWEPVSHARSRCLARCPEVGAA